MALLIAAFWAYVAYLVIMFVAGVAFECYDAMVRQLEAFKAKFKDVLKVKQ